jgi:hypothetical protein
MIWYTRDAAALGLLPDFLSAHDPRGAVAQLNGAYAHGGGWQPLKGFTLLGSGSDDFALQYPGDPPMRLIGWTMLRGEFVGVFQGEWVAVVQPDGDFEVCRMD